MNDLEKTQPLLAQEVKDTGQDLTEEHLSNIQGGALTRSLSAAGRLEGRNKLAESLQRMKNRALTRTGSDNMLIGKQPAPSYAAGLTPHIPLQQPGSPAETWEGTSTKVHPV